MRVSKSLAKQIAGKMLEKKYQEIKDIEKERNELFISYYLETLPKNVIKCFESNQEYINKHVSFSLNGIGLMNYEITINEGIPSTDNCRINVSVTIAEKMNEYRNVISDKIKAVRSLRSNLEAALFKLATPARIAENLPEAVPFLPKENKLEIAINFSDLRNQLV